MVKNLLSLLTFILMLLGLGVEIHAQALISSTFLESRSKSTIQTEFNPFAQYGVNMYKITYTTPDIEGVQDTASGLVVVPSTPGLIWPLLCYQHGTVDGPNDVPSNLQGGFELAVVFASMGYITSAADYLGMGESRGFHPYVHADSEASAAIDMLFAVRDFATDNDLVLNDQLFVTGYSQGGHAAMAVHRALERDYSDEFTVTASAPMSGPYSISGVMRDLILSDVNYFFPAYIPNTILSYNEVYKIYDDPIKEVFNSLFHTDIRAYYIGSIGLFDLNTRMINDMNTFYGGPRPDVLVRDSIKQAITNDPSHPVNVALADNDVFKWVPQAPTRLYYCEGDDQVPFMNSVVAKDTMIALGTQDIDAINLNSNFNHGQCVEPAATNTILFFAQFQDIVSNADDISFNDYMKIFPNPTKGNIQIEGLPNLSTIELMDMNGQILRKWLTQDENETLSLEGIYAGSYLIRVQSDNSFVTRKLLVIR